MGVVTQSTNRTAEAISANDAESLLMETSETWETLPPAFISLLFNSLLFFFFSPHFSTPSDSQVGPFPRFPRFPKNGG